MKLERVKVNHNNSRHSREEKISQGLGASIISIREYIMKTEKKESSEKKENIEMDKTTFKKGLKKIRKERYDLAKNLSKR